MFVITYCNVLPCVAILCCHVLTHSDVMCYGVYPQIAMCCHMLPCVVISCCHVLSCVATFRCPVLLYCVYCHILQCLAAMCCHVLTRVCHVLPCFDMCLPCVASCCHVLPLLIQAVSRLVCTTTKAPRCSKSPCMPFLKKRSECCSESMTGNTSRVRCVYSCACFTGTFGLITLPVL